MWIKFNDKEILNANKLDFIIHNGHKIQSSIGGKDIEIYFGFYDKQVYDLIVEGIENNKHFVDISMFNRI